MWNKYFGGRGVAGMEAFKAQAHLTHPLLYMAFSLAFLNQQVSFWGSDVYQVANFPWRYFAYCPLNSFNFPCNSYCFLEMDMQVHE